MAEIVKVGDDRFRLNGNKQIKLCRGTIYDIDGERQCNNMALSGRNNCRHHGGRTLIGPAHPNFVTGLASIVINVLVKLVSNY